MTPPIWDGRRGRAAIAPFASRSATTCSERLASSRSTISRLRLLPERSAESARRRRNSSDIRKRKRYGLVSPAKGADSNGLAGRYQATPRGVISTTRDVEGRRVPAVISARPDREEAYCANADRAGIRAGSCRTRRSAGRRRYSRGLRQHPDAADRERPVP